MMNNLDCFQVVILREHFYSEVLVLVQLLLVVLILVLVLVLVTSEIYSYLILVRSLIFGIRTSVRMHYFQNNQENKKYISTQRRIL